MFSIDGLNPAQKEAAQILEGPLLILAGAGSGKTRTVTFRIANMVENYHIPPSQILAVSFTNKAAGEMRERVGKLLGRKKARAMTLSTFHSLGVQILREQIDRLGYRKRFSIFDTSDSISAIREGLKQYRADKNFDKKMIQTKISFLKNKGIPPEDFLDSPYYDPDEAYDHATEFAYAYYQEKLKFFNAIDFDDILFLSVTLFRKFPELRSEYSKKFRFIMIDEFQDTNPLQLELVRYLTTEHQNLCVVGDDDQSIYAFRGADVSNILNFEKFYPGARVVKLEQNYRSNSGIIDLANVVIAENIDRKPKRMFTDNKVERLPELWACGDTDHEAAIIVEDILKSHKDGKPLSECAILYRSNTQVPPFEEELRLQGLPYKIYGGQKLFEKKEVKDLIAYLALINNPGDELSLRRIINTPSRGIGTTTLKRYLDISDQNKQSLYKAISHGAKDDPKKGQVLSHFVGLIAELKDEFRRRPLAEAVEKAIERIDYNAYIEKSYRDNPNIMDRKKNDVKQFIESARRFERHFEGANLGKFLEKLLLQDAQDKDDEEEEEIKHEVTLMTLHSSKGLEYDQVYFVGVEEELLPHKRSIAEGNVSEERRLTYVGITRARQKLVMSYAKEREMYGKKIERHPSRFIAQLDKEYKKIDRTTFGHMSEEEAQDYKKSFFQGLSDML